jgi:hypothetical protein
MGKYVAKLADDAYVEWSTVVDAPLSWVLSRQRAIGEWGHMRVLRADKNGTSILDDYPAGETPDEIVRGNRAGPQETEISVADILSAYAEDNPAPWTIA